MTSRVMCNNKEEERSRYRLKTTGSVIDEWKERKKERKKGRKKETLI